MLDGNRLPHPALGWGLAALFVLFAVGASVLKPTLHRSEHPDYHHAYAAQSDAYARDLLPSLPTPHINVQPYHLEYNASDNTAEHDGEGSIKWTDKVIALFTIVLAGVGGISGYIAYLQWGALKDQVTNLEEAVEAEKTASNARAAETQQALTTAGTHAQAALEQAGASMRAAAAAELSAQASVGVNLPILFIEKIESVSADTTTELGEYTKTFRPKITVRNYGITPAFVTDVVINVLIANLLPLPPEFKIHDRFPQTKVIEGKNSMEFTNWLFKPEEEITATMVEALVNKGEQTGPWLHVFGYIQFTDFMGKSHRKGFAHWHTSTRTFVQDDTRPDYQIQT